MRKSLLLILKSSPWSTNKSYEGLDIALSAASFELPISLVFLDDGVYLLQKNTNPNILSKKKFEPIIKSLDIFGIDNIFISKESLKERGLLDDIIDIEINITSDESIKRIIQENEFTIII